MKEAWQKTRKFTMTLRTINSQIIDILYSNDDSVSKREVKECDGQVEELMSEYGYEEWSAENWTPMIRELLDSVDRRSELQESYNVWIKKAWDLFVQTDRDSGIKPKLDKKSFRLADEIRTTMRKIENMLREHYWLIQELKLEYDLYDTEDYQPIAFVELDYPHGPEALRYRNEYLAARDALAGKSEELPDVLNTALARVIFAKATAKGWMEKTESGYIWKGIGAKGKVAQLAYLSGRLYGYKHRVSGNAGNEFPDNELCQLFGVKKLYNQLTQVHSAQKPQKWRSVIDELFDEDTYG